VNNSATRNWFFKFSISDPRFLRSWDCPNVLGTIFSNTGTLLLARFFGTQKNRVKGKPRYKSSILVLKHENGTFFTSKVHFLSKMYYKESDEFIQSDNFQAKKDLFPKLINILQWKYDLIMS
jgi:hypothetical protein